jgi:quercetin dioxygenase-like cupin family protein
MNDTLTSRLRPLGATSGSAQRSPQHLALPMMSFDLEREQEQLRNEESYRAGDRNAKTLVKEPGLRVVLTVMRSGAQLQEHKAPGPIAIQALKGHIRLRTLEDVVELPAGHVVTLLGDIAHIVEAVEESAFLLTIAATER